MKVLLINISIHQKNLHALLHYNIEITNVSSSNLNFIDLSQFDVVYSPSQPIDVKKYPNTKFIFGPHFSVFPENNLIIIKGNKSIYVQPSKWVVDLWYNFPICKDLIIKELPFGVDTNKFTPIKNISDRHKVFIYYKRRNPQDLNILQHFLRAFNINFKIFDYVNKYNENDIFVKILG